MSAYQRNVLVGAVVLVALGVLAWMVLQFANQAATFFLSSGMKITLTSQRAEGVGDGSPITYKGVSVGRVTGVRRAVNESDGAETVVIDALIDANPPLPANLHGRIKQTSLLGASATIALETVPESTSRPAGKKERAGHLKELANLPAEYVPDITSLGDDVRDLSRSMQKTVESINTIIGDPDVQKDVKLSLSNIREASASATRLAAQLEKVSVNLDKLSDESSGTIGEVRVTVKDVRMEMQKFTKNLGDRMDQLAVSLQHVQSVAKKIDEGKGTAGQLVNDPKLYDSLNDTASELKLMVKDMRRLIDQWEKEGIVKF